MVYTNAIQAGIMVVVATILIGSGYEHFSDGVHGFLGKLGAISPSLASPTNPQSYFFRDYFEIIFCGAVVGVAIVCQPHILTRSLLLKKEGQVNWFLATVSVVMVLFFTVIISGLYARIAMPNFLAEGIKPDGLMAAWVVKEFPVWIALVVVLGLIAAGVSTLEGLIQAVSTTITTDLLKPIFGRFYPREGTDRFEMKLNRVVIAVMGLAALLISYQQLKGAFSVIVLVQNGVYTFVAAALVPVLFGTFLDNVPRIAPVLASITAIVVHWTIYLGGLTPYMKAPVKNPGVPAAIAVVSAVVVGTVALLVARALQRQRAQQQQQQEQQPRPRPASAHGAS
jgi:sodium/pantothenate symporter